MRKTLLIILTALMAVSFSGCTYLSNTFEYSNDAKDFMKDLMQKDYNKCIGLMDQGKDATKATNDALKGSLDETRTQIVTSFGTSPDYSYLKADTVGTMRLMPMPNTTVIFLQVSNDTNLGVIETQFNKKTGKIEYIKLIPGMTEPIPDMANFWFFGMITLCVLLFNLYMVRRVKRSDMDKKWVKYLTIICLNLPSIRYGQSSGLILFYLPQLFFGVNFIKGGYPGSAWIFGIPLGGIYILWQLRTGKYIKAPKKPKPQRVKGKAKS